MARVLACLGLGGRRLRVGIELLPLSGDAEGLVQAAAQLGLNGLCLRSPCERSLPAGLDQRLHGGDQLPAELEALASLLMRGGIAQHLREAHLLLEVDFLVVLQPAVVREADGDLQGGSPATGRFGLWVLLYVMEHPLGVLEDIIALEGGQQVHDVLHHGGDHSGLLIVVEALVL